MNDPHSYTNASGQVWRRDYEMMRAAADVGLARHTAMYAMKQQRASVQMHNEDRMQRLQEYVDTCKQPFRVSESRHHHRAS
jgi:hypothetical protein